MKKNNYFLNKALQKIVQSVRKKDFDNETHKNEYIRKLANDYLPREDKLVKKALNKTTTDKIQKVDMFYYHTSMGHYIGDQQAGARRTILYQLILNEVYNKLATI